MRLEISVSAIKAVMRPYNFSFIDVLSIQPRLEVGAFNACALHVIPDKILIITKGIIMMYNNMEDFLSGKEPVSLVKDENIHYDQGAGVFEFKLIDDIKREYDQESYAEIRELMFGARVEQAENELKANELQL